MDYRQGAKLIAALLTTIFVLEMLLLLDAVSLTGNTFTGASFLLQKHVEWFGELAIGVFPVIEFIGATIFVLVVTMILVAIPYGIYKFFEHACIKVYQFINKKG